MVNFNRPKTLELSPEVEEALRALFRITDDNLLSITKAITEKDNLKPQIAMTLTSTVVLSAAIRVALMAIGLDAKQCTQDLVHECIDLITERIDKEVPSCVR